MNWFALAFMLAKGITLGIQTLVGDKASGATKKQMAQDELNVALQTAVPALSGDNAALAQAAGAVTSVAIDQAVLIHKTSGAYQKATAIATAAQQDAGVAQAVSDLVKSVQAPQTPATATP